MYSNNITSNDYRAVLFVDYKLEFGIDFEHIFFQY